MDRRQHAAREFGNGWWQQAEPRDAAGPRRRGATEGVAGMKEHTMAVDSTRLEPQLAHEGDVVRPSAHEQHGAGLRVRRRFTKPGQDPYATIKWARRTSRIT